MGGAVGSRPKSAALVALYYQHREALVADWLRVYGIVWQPLLFGDWLRDKASRGNLGIGAAWRMTRTIMQDTNASHCWAMLTGAWRLANGAEEVAWDEAAAAKRIKRGSSWRPWLDKHLDPFRPALVRNSRATDRAALNRQFDITDD